MERRPEPELMLDPEQARAYAAADFAEPHQRFVALLRARLPELPPRGRALDLGCGTADVTLRVARTLPGWEVDGLDGSEAMLTLGRRAVARAGLADRVHLHRGRLPEDAPPREDYDLVFTNSLLHHLPDPRVLWQALRRYTRPGGFVFVMDLTRPPSPAAAARLVRTTSGEEPEILRRDFYRSLLAAYRPEEVWEQLQEAGLEELRVEVVSNRHVVAYGRPGGPGRGGRAAGVT